MISPTTCRVLHRTNERASSSSFLTSFVLYGMLFCRPRYAAVGVGAPRPPVPCQRRRQVLKPFIPSSIYFVFQPHNPAPRTHRHATDPRCLAAPHCTALQPAADLGPARGGAGVGGPPESDAGRRRLQPGDKSNYMRRAGEAALTIVWRFFTPPSSSLPAFSSVLDVCRCRSGACCRRA